MATVTFLWHLHQPSYRTADGRAHAPWALMHAGGAYTTLARAIADVGGRGQVLNLVPTLVEQLEAYRDGRVYDPVAEALTRPTADLGAEGRDTLLEWSFHVTPRQIERFPRLRELRARRDARPDGRGLEAVFGPGDLRDLQVLFVLAQAGEQAWADERLRPLFEAGRHFSEEDRAVAASWLEAQPGELLEMWRSLARQEGVEIATSPFAHPIMPLLIDTAVVEASWAPHPAPWAPSFRHPEDARWQLEEGLAFMAERGLEAVGCWPPEGSVSAAALEVYHQAGVRWLVTDEGILERSLGRPIRHGGGAEPELYRPWQLENNGPALLFRDRWLSDRIGFDYGHWEDEERAADDLLRHLGGLARQLPGNASIVIALDGENPWLHYPHGGGTFLRRLMGRLGEGGPELVPATMTETIERAAPDRLTHLHPGSWIGGTFSTWIGHPEKSRGWQVLADVREAIEAAGGERPPSLLVAEASDWFWWLGDDNPTPLAPLYDHIFRRHLRDACEQAGVEPPASVDDALKTATIPLRMPVSFNWPPPNLDGRVTSYFEWSLAGWIEAEQSNLLQRLAVRGSGDRIFLLVESNRPLHQVLAQTPLTVVLQPADGETQHIEVGVMGCESDQVGCAVGTVLELSIPWDGQGGFRLQVQAGPHHLPEGAMLVLEPVVVDEEPVGGGTR